MSTLKERLAKKRKQLESTGGSYKFFRIVEGTTRMRLVPVGEEKDWALEATVFYLGKDLGYVISPITFGGKCKIMIGYNELSASKSEKDRKFAKTFKPSKRYFAPAYKYKDEKGKEVDVESGVKPLMMTGGQYQDCIDMFLDEEDAGDFTHPIEGYDLKFGRTGKTQTDTEYTVRQCKPTKAYKKFRGEIDLEEMIKGITPTYTETKELMERFLNIEPEDDDDDEPKDKKKKKKKRDL